MSQPQLTILQKILATQEGKRRRAAYIARHPPEGEKNLAPAGWDEPLVGKKRRKRKKK